MKRSESGEGLKGYCTFGGIVKVIKEVILKRTQKDKNNNVHFFSKAYRPTLYRYLSLKQIKGGRFAKVLTKNGSGTSTDEELYMSPKKYNQGKEKKLSK